MTKTQSAFLLSVQRLGRHNPCRPDQLYMWTFTLPTVVSVRDAKSMWNLLLTLLRQRYPRLRGLRVFEMHDSHGLHVHLLTCFWLDVNQVRAIAVQAGWGRINAMRMPVAEAGGYLSKYFHRREPCLKGWRLWDGFGDWEWTKVKDVIIDSPFSRIYRACKEWLGWKGNYDFFHRMRLVRCLWVRTIVEGWKDGLGPGDQPYSSFLFWDLFGYRRLPVPPQWMTTHAI
jgi:hypothetical protein